MSHEMVSADGRLVYMMPALPSDVLRHGDFQYFFRDYRGAPFTVQTRDGWSWSSSFNHNPAFTATFSSCAELDAVINDSTDDSLSRMFLEGKLDIQGELLVLLSVAEYVLRHSNGLSRSLISTISRASLDWMKGIRSHRSSSVAAWRSNTCLYDVPGDFLEPWLGASLGHFCARFRSSKESLDDAQQHALQQVCSALKLDEHDRLLDLSCGWGSVLIYAMTEYGLSGQGIAFSQQQAATIAERLRQRDLDGRCAVECRTSAEPVGAERAFEKIIDIGLFDQVAHFSFRSYLEQASRRLSPGGMLLMHRTTRRPGASRKGTDAPHLESSGFGLLSSELQVAESSGYQILNVEDLSEDYQHTLHRWIERLRCYAAPHKDIANRQFRFWLFCLLDTAAKVDVGEIQLEQILLRRGSLS
jgi:cyclopropane-fatty-acyl-phospholipid synthase